MSEGTLKMLSKPEKPKLSINTNFKNSIFDLSIRNFAAELNKLTINKASCFKLNRKSTGMLSSDIVSKGTQNHRLRRMENNLIFTQNRYGGSKTPLPLRSLNQSFSTDTPNAAMNTLDFIKNESRILYNKRIEENRILRNSSKKLKKLKKYGKIKVLHLRNKISCLTSKPR